VPGSARRAPIRRRVFLRWLAGAATWAVAAGVTALRWPTPRPTLSRSDRRLALLGRRARVEAPERTRRLIRQVARSAARAPRAAHAELVRSQWLDRERTRRELERGDVLVVDGWVLSRSEAATCAYLHALSMHEPPAV
jgi:hypothetical protein